MNDDDYTRYGIRGDSTRTQTPLWIVRLVSVGMLVIVGLLAWSLYHAAPSFWHGGR